MKERYTCVEVCAPFLKHEESVPLINIYIKLNFQDKKKHFIKKH